MNKLLMCKFVTTTKKSIPIKNYTRSAVGESRVIRGSQTIPRYAECMSSSQRRHCPYILQYRAFDEGEKSQCRLNIFDDLLESPLKWPYVPITD